MPIPQLLGLLSHMDRDAGGFHRLDQLPAPCTDLCGVRHDSYSFISSNRDQTSHLLLPMKRNRGTHLWDQLTEVGPSRSYRPGFLYSGVHVSSKAPLELPGNNGGAVLCYSSQPH